MIASFVILYVWQRRLLSEYIPRPVEFLSHRIPALAAYIRDGDRRYRSLTPLGSAELSATGIALQTMVQRLRAAIEKQMEDQTALDRAVTIPQTAQMLAHDLHQPFALLQATLGTLANVR